MVKQMEAKQVQDSDRRQRRRCQVGTLRQHGSDKQATVAAAVQGELFGGGDPGLFEMIGDRDVVIEDVLLASQAAGLVPGSAELSPASQIGDRQQATRGQPA